MEFNQKKYPMKMIQRFFAKIKKPMFENECWEWIGASKDGYGYFRNTLTKKQTRVNRLSFDLFNGPLDENLLVLHTCDNSKCVNPKHLFQGTHGDNVRDKVNKGRSLFGELCPTSVLTEVFIKQLIVDILNGHNITIQQVCHWTGVSITTIRDIFLGNTWKHVTTKFSKEDLKYAREIIIPSRKLKIKE